MTSCDETPETEQLATELTAMLAAHPGAEFVLHIPGFFAKALAHGEKLERDRNRLREQLADETPKSAKQQYDKYTADEAIDDPIEALRFFCALAMNEHDWLDVEQFFDALMRDRNQLRAQLAGVVERAAKVCKYPSVDFQRWANECCTYDGFGITRQRTAQVIERILSETEQAIRALSTEAPTQAPQRRRGEPVAVQEGESRWLIERTYAKGQPAERREFWLGSVTGNVHHDSYDHNAEGENVWTLNALDAARFATQEIAYTLRLRHFHPEAPVDVCEHLFQCGITSPQADEKAREDAARLDWMEAHPWEVYRAIEDAGYKSRSWKFPGYRAWIDAARGGKHG